MPTSDPPEIPDEVDSIEDVEEGFQAVRAKVEPIDDTIQTIFARLGELQEEIQRRDQRIDELEQQIERMQVASSSQKGGKIEKISDVLDYAESEATGGRYGVTLVTGEVAAAASCSRDTALRIMDEIGGSMPWAMVENPGGPKPKQLKLQTGDHDPSKMLQDVTARYGEKEAA